MDVGVDAGDRAPDARAAAAAAVADPLALGDPLDGARLSAERPPGQVRSSPLAVMWTRTVVTVPRISKRRRRAKSSRTVEVTRFRVAILGVVGVIWTLLSPSIGAAVLPTEKVSGSIKDTVTSEPSRAEKVVGAYVRVARRATTWERPPTIHKPSVTYFKRHFSNLDPERPHRYPGLDKAPPVSIPDLAVGSRDS